MKDIIISNICIRVPELRNRTKLRVNIQRGNTKDFFRIEDISPHIVVTYKILRRIKTNAYL